MARAPPMASTPSSAARTTSVSDPQVELAQPSSQLLASDLWWVVVRDAGVDLDDVGDGPETGTRVGQAAALAPVIDVGETIEVLLQLPGQSALAHAGTAHDGDEVGLAIVHGPTHRLLEQSQLGVRPTNRDSSPSRARRPPRPALTARARQAATATDLPFSSRWTAPRTRPRRGWLRR